jgi:hypothetical protein
MRDVGAECEGIHRARWWSRDPPVRRMWLRQHAGTASPIYRGARRLTTATADTPQASPPASWWINRGAFVRPGPNRRSRLPMNNHRGIPIRGRAHRLNKLARTLRRGHGLRVQQRVRIAEVLARDWRAPVHHAWPSS